MRRFIWLTIVVIVIAALGYAIWHHPQTQTAQRGRRGGQNGPIPVLVAKAQQQNVPIWLSGLGTVQAFNTVTVHSMIDGPLIDVRFKEGDEVKTGDVLARIDPRPYQAALDQAVAKKAQDDANLANAKLDLARYTKLAVTNYTTQQQADTQRATVKMDEAIVEQDQAAIDTARTNLSYTTIASPIDGRTGIRQVDQGNIIHTSDTNGLVVITQMHPISVIFTLPQQDLQRVRAAQQKGPVTVRALPQGATEQEVSIAQAESGPGLAASSADDPPGDPPPGAPSVLDTGQLAVLDNQVDPSTGTIKLKATFPNPQLKLWPGGFVNVQLLARTAENATTVPPAAVQLGPNGSYVYVVQNDKAERRNVTVGHQDEQVAIVTKGLNPGEMVVTDGASRLTDGAAVTIAQPPGATAPTAAPQSTTPPGTAHGRRHRPQQSSPS